MHTWPIPKGVRPLDDVSMHNFVYWLATRHKGKLTQLRHLPAPTILDLIEQFNQERPDLKADQGKWLASLEKLLNPGTSQDDYTKVRNTLKTLE